MRREHTMKKQQIKTTTTTTEEVDMDFLFSLIPSEKVSDRLPLMEAIMEATEAPAPKAEPKARTGTDWAYKAPEIVNAREATTAPPAVVNGEVFAGFGNPMAEAQARLKADAERDARRAARRAAKVAAFRAREEAEKAEKARKARERARVVRKTKARQAVKVGDYVFYTSKAGTRKRYRVAALGRGGSLQLEMLGHSSRDRLKGKRFWAKRAQCVRDSYKAGTANGGRICVCGDRSCQIGPFNRY